MKKSLTSFFIFFLVLAVPAEAAVTPNDPYYSREWYIGKINADSAWEKVNSSPDIVIAVIDSGVDINHPDLVGNIWHNPREVAGNHIDDDQNGFIDDVHGWDFVTNTPDPSPKFAPGWTESGISHGTMIAGIIAATGNNGLGLTGVTWQAQIMPLRVLNEKGEGKTNDVIRAIDYAINNGADIINLSFTSLNYNADLQAAIQRAHDAGVIVVAAAGNEQSGGAGYDTDKTPIYPACYDGDSGENMVIGVAATDALDQKTKFSGYGSHCVDISAPGIGFFSTVVPGSVSADPNASYDGYWAGTSFSSALVTAALALIMQADPELSPREVVNILFASTDNIDRLNPAYIGRLGNGRLDINRAVTMAKDKLYSSSGRLVVTRGSGSEAKLTAPDGDLVNKLPGLDLKIGSLAGGDLNGDGTDEIITGAAAGAAPLIRIFSSGGQTVRSFLAFDKSFTGGVNVAVGDINGDGQPEIIAAPASRGNGQIRVFDATGHLLRQFSADSQWRGGLTLAVGNVDGLGQAEIVTGYGPGGPPQVRIFSAAGKEISAFLAYEPGFRGGVRVAAADLNGRRDRSRAVIIVAPGPGREPLIKIFDNRAVVQKQFLAYGRNWQGGVNLAAGDVNDDGVAEIVVGASAGATPHVRTFDGSGRLLDAFYAWEPDWSGGVNVGIIKVGS